MADRLRFGILSTGNIAQQFAAGVRGSRRCTLAAVASRAQGSADAFAQAQQVGRAYGSYDQLLADSEVDAIYIGLPNSMHHEWTIKALGASKHVLCEKPIASNQAQAAEMFEVARARGKVLAEAFMYRSHPQTKKLMETIKAGAIGEVRFIRTSFTYKTTRIAENIRFRPDLAGGALMDIGCYCIDFSQLIAGRAPSSVSAYAVLHQSGVDELVAGAMQFPGGMLATFTCGMTAEANNSAQICGTAGYIEIPVPWKPAAGGAKFTIAYGIPPRMDGGAASKRPAPELVRVAADDNVYSYEADDFAAAVLDGAVPQMPAESTLSNMRILDELRKQVGVL